MQTPIISLEASAKIMQISVKSLKMHHARGDFPEIFIRIGHILRVDASKLPSISPVSA